MNAIFAFLSPQTTMVVLILVLLLFGAKKLPELARGMGKSLGEFKKARQESEDEELVKKEEEKKS